MRNRRQRSQMAAIDQINMTPLMDLVFLLLIVFMISMPLMEYGTDVKTPELNSAALPDDNFKYIALKNDGSLEIDKQILSYDQFKSLLKKWHAENPDYSINIRADGSREYNEVIAILREVKAAGFAKFSLVTQAERK